MKAGTVLYLSDIAEKVEALASILSILGIVAIAILMALGQPLVYVVAAGAVSILCISIGLLTPSKVTILSWAGIAALSGVIGKDGDTVNNLICKIINKHIKGNA